MATRQDASTGEIVNDSKPEDKAAGDSMEVKVYSPFKVYFEGQAKSISAESDTGPFDILKGHHNFITLLSPCDLIIRISDGQEAETIRIGGGIMHVKADVVIVFLDV